MASTDSQLQPQSPVERERESGGGLVRTLKDLFAGAAGGVAQVLLGELVALFLFTYYLVCFF